MQTQSMLVEKAIRYRKASCASNIDGCKMKTDLLGISESKKGGKIKSLKKGVD